MELLVILFLLALLWGIGNIIYRAVRKRRAP